MRLSNHLSIADLERSASRRLPASIFGYVSGGAEDHRAVVGNRTAFNRWVLVPRMLTGVAERSQEVEIFGQRYTSPVGIAPMGLAGLCAYEGDLQLAAAARDAKVPFVLSAASTVPLEKVAMAAPGSWYQGYLSADRSTITPLLARIERAGFGVLVITVDVPLAAQRENELRNGFSVPLRLSRRLVYGGLARPRWLLSTFGRTLLTQGVPHFENFTANRGGPIITGATGDHRSGRAALCWNDIHWIRSQWKGTLVVKGILHPDDALRAKQAGADGIIVSNHGGRQLDGALATLDALPAITAVAGDMPVILDSGVRRGTDVIKALSLGARLVLVGRPAMYGLAVGGHAGVRHALQLLRREIDVDLALLGCPRIEKLNRDFVVQVSRESWHAAHG
ncbi:L-lactate dehydrogenase (cytochrome) [Burkholderia sp. OAS925]|uniref:alpha-hydroxy acid oxidase n=1 Tax=Paraburkholderia TaxID=1822464 RepID=UPI00178AF2E7|nr:alpha-hydroxy acid oxidase [Paraburkholderia graminis]MDR6475957.1 L-lactate dehydrogenase (cytochrome) [Paraburkholderia graminis]